MAKITITNLTQSRVHIPAPVGRSIGPQGSITLERVSDDLLARSAKITALIDKKQISAVVDNDPSVDDSIEARLLLGPIGAPLSNTTPEPISTVASPGVSAEVSRSDHRHVHGNQAGGTEHANATTVVAGFMSAADKTKLNAIEANAKDDQTITAGTGLTGGGTGDVALAVSFGQAAGTVTEGNDARLPTTQENDALAGTDGTPSNINRYVTDTDPRNTNARTPTGAASGDLGGTYPAPRVDAITAAGPTQLMIGTINDGEVLTRSGATIISSAVSGAPLSNNTPQDVGTATAGVAVETSRSDHVHAHGTQGGGTEHTAATTGTAGFMSTSDKSKLDAIESNAKDDQTITASTGLSGGGTGDVSLSVVYGSSAGTAVQGNDTRVPSQDENDALAGTSGIPSNTNRFVTNADTRNTNARTPLAHATLHGRGFSDPITVQNLASGGATVGHLLAADGIGGLTFTSPGAPGLHAATHGVGGLDTLDVSDLSSGAAAVGTVATADGAGNVTFTHPAQTVQVAKSGGQYTSVVAALTNITDASASKPYSIMLAPGIYDEVPFTLKPYVSIVGQGSMIDTVLRTTDNNAHFITSNSAVVLRDLSIVGPTGVGFAAIDHTTESMIPLILHHVLILSGYYGVWCHPASSRGLVHCFFVANHYNGTTIDTFFRATDYGNITAISSAVMSGPPGAFTNGYVVDGANAEMTLDQCSFRNSGSTNGVLADNGASLRLNGMVFTTGTTAIRIGSGGSGTLVQAAGCVILDNFTNDILVESASAILRYTGIANKTKVTITSGATISASFSDVTSGEAGLVVFGELWLGTDNDSIPLRSYGVAAYSTGYVSGGAVTRAGGLDVDVAAGTGFINTGTGVLRVTWAPDTVTLTDDSIQWISVDVNGVVSISLVEPDYAQFIILSLALTSNGFVNYLTKHEVPIDQRVGFDREYFDDVLGSVTISGGLVTEASPPSLQVAATSAVYYTGNVRRTSLPANPVSFTYWYSDGSGGWVAVPSQTALDPDFYDDGSGTLQAMPAGYFKRDLLFVTVSDDGTEYHVIYGQAPYATQLLAEQAGTQVDEEVARTALRLAALIIEEGATIASVMDARPYINQITEPTASTLNHNELHNLTVGDPHTQYQLRSEENLPFGYAGLDGSSKLTGSQQVYGATTNTATEGNDTRVPSQDENDALLGTDGTPSNTNRYVTNSDARNSDSRAPTGAASGQLGGTYPGPDVRGIRETGGPTLLTNGVIVDEQFLQRSGVNLIGKFLDGADVTLEKIGTTTYSNVQHLQDIFHSAGQVSGGGFTDVGGGTVRVAAGSGLIRANVTRTSTLFYFDWAQDDFVIPTNTVRYVGVEYNAGSPQVVVHTALDWNLQTDFPLGSVVNESGVLHFEASPQAVGDHAAQMIQRSLETTPYARDNLIGGVVLGETGTRNVTVTTGAVWKRLNRVLLPAFDSSVSDTFSIYYRDGIGGFTLVGAQTQYPNSQYDDGTGVLAAMTTDYFTVHWFYRELDGHVSMLYGQNEHASVAEARDAAPPSSLPTRLTQSFLIGRIIIQKSAGTASLIESAFTSKVFQTGVSSHNNLGTLQGGVTGEYFHGDADTYDAWAGTSGTPSTTNRFVTDEDARLAAPAAPVNVTKAAAAIGVANERARADHKHDVDTATASGLDANSINTEGTATSLARSDHTHLIDVTNGTISTVEAGDAASAGTGTGLSRRDHQHAVSTAAPTTNVGPATVNSEGVATSLARSDHSHHVVVPVTQVSATTLFSTSSATDVPITGMTITPGAGDYIVMFSAFAQADGGAKLGYFSIYVNGVQITHTERVVNDTKNGVGQAQAYVTGVGVGQAIEVRGRGNTTLIMTNRSLIVQRVN